MAENWLGKGKSADMAGDYEIVDSGDMYALYESARFAKNY